MSKKFTPQKNPIPGRAVVFDTETTGLSPRTGHRIVEIGAVEMIDGEPTGAEFHSYINPCRHVPFEAERVHGLSNAFLRDKPRFEDIAEDWMGFLGEGRVSLWAHNASFDERFLRAELELCGIALEAQISCSLRLSRGLFGKGKHGLDVLAERAGLTFGGRGAHSALADAKVLSDVLAKYLWPQEIKQAALGTSSPVPVSPLPQRQKRQLTAIAFPDDFVPLTTGRDARIRRYDDLDLEGKLRARGTRWQPEDEAELAQAFMLEGAEIPELVERIGRSPAALFLKLEALGVVAPEHPYMSR